MDKIEGFSAVGVEEIERSEFTSSWSIKFMDELDSRKYAQGFNPKFNEVLDWVFRHRERIKNMPFEEQERLMIADGVISDADI